MIFTSFDFLRLHQYNNLLKSWHRKVDSIKKLLCFGKGGIAKLYFKVHFPK